MVDSQQSRTTSVVEFGDFQTPDSLSELVCTVLRSMRLSPKTVVEPTCGTGSFVLAAAKYLPTVERILAFDINDDHLVKLRGKLVVGQGAPYIEVENRNFFDTDWKGVIDSVPRPVLFLGNPPWVTSAALGTLGSKNLPKKSNFQMRSGFDAITGKSNFDISEWMLIQLLDILAQGHASIAMLCKYAVARKVLKHAAFTNSPIKGYSIFKFDAKAYFGVSVESCLLVCQSGPRGQLGYDAKVYPDLKLTRTAATIGVRRGILASNPKAFDVLNHLYGRSEITWRSGVKHDCSKVMEFVKEEAGLKNGLGEIVAIEARYVYPMLKSSDLANGRIEKINRRMLVTQQGVGEDTGGIAHSASRTMQYLLQHADLLDSRKSSIYQKQPRFAIFGIGKYSFAPWKVAIAGLYKTLHFKLIGPYEFKPVMLDDTCYFLPFEHESDARTIHTMLMSKPAQEFLLSIIFWDAKRPITKDILDKLSLTSLAHELNTSDSINQILAQSEFGVAPTLALRSHRATI